MITLPKEIDSENIEKLDEILPETEEVRIVRGDEIVKVKFRTPTYLWTIKLSPEEARAVEDRVRELDIEVKYY